jgi:tetratricopeptide (TPR) repeat protein
VKRIPTFWDSAHKADDHATARRDFEQVVKLNPNAGLAYYYLGAIVEATLPEEQQFSRDPQATDNDRRILEFYKKAIATSPTLVRPYLARANVHWYLHHWDKAVKDYTMAITLEPEKVDNYNRRAQVFTEMHEYRKAADDFSTAIEKTADPQQRWPYYQQRADALLDSREFDKAVDDFSHAIAGVLQSMIPYTIGIKEFRVLYPEFDSTPDEALIRKLYSLVQDRGRYEIFAKAFTDEESHHGFDDAAELAGLYYHRADAYNLAGNLRKAMDDYRRALIPFQKFIERYPGLYDRWRPVFVTTDTDDLIDARTVEYPSPKRVRFWLKIVERDDKKTPGSTLGAMEVDCSAKKIKTASITAYDTKGNVLSTTEPNMWETVLPDTLGEHLYEGFCRWPSFPFQCSVPSALPPLTTDAVNAVRGAAGSQDSKSSGSVTESTSLPTVILVLLQLQRGRPEPFRRG